MLRRLVAISSPASPLWPTFLVALVAFLGGCGSGQDKSRTLALKAADSQSPTTDTLSRDKDVPGNGTSDRSQAGAEGEGGQSVGGPNSGDSSGTGGSSPQNGNTGNTGNTPTPPGPNPKPGACGGKSLVVVDFKNTFFSRPESRVSIEALEKAVCTAGHGLSVYSITTITSAQSAGELKSALENAHAVWIVSGGTDNPAATRLDAAPVASVVDGLRSRIAKGGLNLTFFAGVGNVDHANRMLGELALAGAQFTAHSSAPRGHAFHAATFASFKTVTANAATGTLPDIDKGALIDSWSGTDIGPCLSDPVAITDMSRWALRVNDPCGAVAWAMATVNGNRIVLDGTFPRLWTGSAAMKYAELLVSNQP